MIRRTWIVAAGFAALAAVGLVVAVVAGRAHRTSLIDGRNGNKIELTSAEMRGRQIFLESCASCHTLNAVAARGRTGPDLDFIRPPARVVRWIIREGSTGRAGTMPPKVVTGQDAADVATFVARVAGR